MYTYTREYMFRILLSYYTFYTLFKHLSALIMYKNKNQAMERITYLGLVISLRNLDPRCSAVYGPMRSLQFMFVFDLAKLQQSARQTTEE